MTLRKKKDYYYGDNHEDLRKNMLAWSKSFGETINEFADAHCSCGHAVFECLYDENAGVAKRICNSCCKTHVMCDGEEYISDVDQWNKAECICGNPTFQLSAGVCLYEDSEDVHWFFLGLRCTQCSIVGVYADWKSECENYKEFLANA